MVRSAKLQKCRVPTFFPILDPLFILQLERRSSSRFSRGSLNSPIINGFFSFLCFLTNYVYLTELFLKFYHLLLTQYLIYSDNLIDIDMQDFIFLHFNKELKLRYILCDYKLFLNFYWHVRAYKIRYLLIIFLM